MARSITDRRPYSQDANRVVVGQRISIIDQLPLNQFFLFQAVSRALGQNLFGGLVINATLTKWFVAHRGWALASALWGCPLRASSRRFP